MTTEHALPEEGCCLKRTCGRAHAGAHTHTNTHTQTRLHRHTQVFPPQTVPPRTKCTTTTVGNDQEVSQTFWSERRTTTFWKSESYMTHKLQELTKQSNTVLVKTYKLTLWSHDLPCNYIAIPLVTTIYLYRNCYEDQICYRLAIPSLTQVKLCGGYWI